MRAGEIARRRRGARWGGRSAHLDSAATPHVAASRRIPQGRKAARVSELCGCVGGPHSVPRGVRPVVPVGAGALGFASWSHRSRSIAATGPRPSPRSSARITSPSRCGPRSRTTGSTTPTSSPDRAAAARPRRPGSWPARSTASRRRSPIRAASATAAASWPAAAAARSTSSRSTRPPTVASTTPATCGRRPSSRRSRPLQGLHHRRGPHGHHAGLQRPAQAGRGAAAAPAVHLRHHRARQGAADHPLAHPPLPVPADPAAPAERLPLPSSRRGGRRDRAGRAAARRARRRRVGPRHPVRARPAAGRRRSRRA